MTNISCPNIKTIYVPQYLGGSTLYLVKVVGLLRMNDRKNHLRKGVRLDTVGDYI